MTFIHVQKAVKDDNGRIIGGYASITESVYDSDGKHHSKHKIVEKLGKILYLSEDKKSGIFLSSTKGIVEYSVTTNTFTPVQSNDSRLVNLPKKHTLQTHTVFGDAYLLLKFLEKSGMFGIFRTIFLKDSDYLRHLAHLLHGILRDGSRITCDNFIGKSFASYLLHDISIASLKSDTAYFEMMGNDDTKMAFFKTYIQFMRKTNKNFGTGCYIDSTPLPNDIVDHPMNALSCHGTNSSSKQIRLIMILDEETGLPIWYDIIPGNVLDISTIKYVVEDVAKNLDVKINSFVLDAGYTSKELINEYNLSTPQTIITRMPQRKGYPYKTLYNEVKSEIIKGKYAFICNKHSYFGTRKIRKIFDKEEYVYIYIDYENANSQFKQFMEKNEEIYDGLKAKDKDWIRISGGYFVLISNRELEPKELLIEYHNRAKIEYVFKTAKDYLDLLPLEKWTDLTVRGKILADIINTIVYLSLQKEILGNGVSMNALIGKTQSLMCSNIDEDTVEIFVPNKQTRDYYNLLKIDIPTQVSLAAIKEELMIGDVVVKN